MLWTGISRRRSGRGSNGLLGWGELTLSEGKVIANGQRDGDQGEKPPAAW